MCNGKMYYIKIIDYINIYLFDVMNVGILNIMK